MSPLLNTFTHFKTLHFSSHLYYLAEHWSYLCVAGGLPTPLLSSHFPLTQHRRDTRVVALDLRKAAPHSTMWPNHAENSNFSNILCSSEVSLHWRRLTRNVIYHHHLLFTFWGATNTKPDSFYLLPLAGLLTCERNVLDKMTHNLHTCVGRVLRAWRPWVCISFPTGVWTSPVWRHLLWTSSLLSNRHNLQGTKTPTHANITLV